MIIVAFSDLFSPFATKYSSQIYSNQERERFFPRDEPIRVKYLEDKDCQI